MAAAGRYLSLRLRVPDRPGSLAAVLAELAAVGANVLEVEHERTDTQLHIGEVEVFVVLETRGPDHADEVRRGADAGGLPGHLRVSRARADEFGARRRLHRHEPKVVVRRSRKAVGTVTCAA